MSECLKKSEEDYSDAKKALQEAAENTTPKHADVVEELSKAGTVAGGAWGWVIAELLGSLGGGGCHPQILQGVICEVLLVVQGVGSMGVDLGDRVGRGFGY